MMAGRTVVAVAPFEDLLRAGLVLDAPLEGVGGLGIVVPGQIEEALIARLGAPRVQRFETLAKLVGEPLVGARVGGWVGGLVMPLQPAMGVGGTAFAFGAVRPGQEERFCLDVGP